jgi:cell division protease FtsH
MALHFSPTYWHAWSCGKVKLFSVPTHAPQEEVIFSDLRAVIEKGDVERAKIKDGHISVVLRDKTRVRTYSPDYPDLVKVLREKEDLLKPFFI